MKPLRAPPLDVAAIERFADSFFGIAEEGGRGHTVVLKVLDELNALSPSTSTDPP